MLYPFHMIREEILSTSLPSASPPATVRILSIVRALNDLFEEAPAVLLAAGGRTTTLLYRDVAYLWRDIADNVAVIAASGNPPLRFIGTTEARETAELSFRHTEKKLVASLRSVSGREFDHLQGLGVQAEWPDPETASQMAELLAAVPQGAPCGVVSNRHRGLLEGCGLLAPTKGSLFSYLAWEPTPARELLLALSPDHKALLWRTFLSDGQQPAEFDWLWEVYSAGESPFLLEWELTLRMALEELGFRVERSDCCFRVIDRKGRKRRFDFTRGDPAEKVFLKLLFPLNTK